MEEQSANDDDGGIFIALRLLILLFGDVPNPCSTFGGDGDGLLLLLLLLRSSGDGGWGRKDSGIGVLGLNSVLYIWPCDDLGPLEGMGMARPWMELTVLKSDGGLCTPSLSSDSEHDDEEEEQSAMRGGSMEGG